MRILQVSDTHIGITSHKTLEGMFRNAAREDFDVLIHCGDYSGRAEGASAVEETLAIMRDAIPDKPILTVLGNHDFWCGNESGAKISLRDFADNLNAIDESCHKHNVILLDKHGPWRGAEPGVVIVGASGWYANPNPPTNDKNYLPNMEGSSHSFLLRRTEADLASNLAGLTEDDTTRIFVSHFPVINTGNDYKGAFESFSWSESIGKLLQDQGFEFFANGHAHQTHKGPLRWECGSDYYNPKYHIIKVNE